MFYVALLLPIFLHASSETMQPLQKKTDPMHQEFHKNAKKTIAMKNSITPEMLTCSHWTGNHKPDSFSLIVDGIALKEGEIKELTAEKNEVDISYQYSFAKGLYKGTRTCKVQIPHNTASCSLVFSWQKEPRIRIETTH